MDYNPKPTQQAVPPSTYELNKDVTGKPPEKRGVYILVDKNGTEIKLPTPPKKNCKKCYGRGHIGIEVRTGKFFICRKCYPFIK